MSEDGNPISEEANRRLRELETHVALAKRDLEEMRRDVEKINGGIGRVLWVAGGGLIMAIVSWILNGGLNDRIQ